MIKQIVLYFISFFDALHQKKIFNFLKKKGIKSFDIMFDVGAHRGETIEVFLKNFKIKNIISFEPSPINYSFLKSKKSIFQKKYEATNIIIENLALGNENAKKNINQFEESSSTSLKEINTDANYYKKKIKVLNLSQKNNLVSSFQINVLKTNEYLKKNNINEINFLKIDTEGYEYEILMGLDKEISKVEIIMFEHHYDDMIKKKYTYSDIYKLLNKFNFKMVYKAKMPFRKTFEYIFFNEVIISKHIK